MKNLTFKIEKIEIDKNPAWGEHLQNAGFERDQFENKYNKKIVTWSKDGVDYIKSKGDFDSNGNLILTLTEYK